MIKNLINSGRATIVFEEMEKSSNKTIPSFQYKKIPAVPILAVTTFEVPKNSDHLSVRLPDILASS